MNEWVILTATWNQPGLVPWNLFLSISVCYSVYLECCFFFFFFCQENTLVIANTFFQQPKKWLYTWTSPDGQYQNQTDYVLCSLRWRSSIQSAHIRPGPDCGSHHELFTAKFRLKLKKVGNTTRPFGYDLHQISYEYTMKVMNRFEGLDMLESAWRPMDEGP